MQSRRQGRIQILTTEEIQELYQRPEFNQAEREEYFSLDEKLLQCIRPMSKIETRLYFILFIGYFRAKPVLPMIHLKDVKEDVSYICKKYFPDEKPQFTPLSKSTRSRLTQQVLELLGFKSLTPESKKSLITRLQDVATIYTNPRYMLDECLAFFGQQRIALPGYSTIQTLITNALSSERLRTEQILSQQMSEETLNRLQAIMNDKSLLNSLSAFKGSARNFSPSELDRELSTHRTIKEVYPEIKELIGSLKLSRGNMLYYASIVKHHSVYKLRRTPKWQGLLYLSCYLFFRYRENNDKLVQAFCYLVTKHKDAAKAFAKQKVTDELDVIR